MRYRVRALSLILLEEDSLLEEVRDEGSWEGREGPGPFSRTDGEHVGSGGATLTLPSRDTSPALS